MARGTAVAAQERGLRVYRSREDRRYSWLEDYLATLDGKEAREEYYARLEDERDRPRAGGRRLG